MSQLIKCVVPKDSVNTGVGKASGKTFTTQSIGLVKPNGLMQEFKNFLRDRSEALEPGNYNVMLGEAYVDKNGNLVLKPVFTKA